MLVGGLTHVRKFLVLKSKGSSFRIKRNMVELKNEDYQKNLRIE